MNRKDFFMKFLHISDLHIGKYVNSCKMLDDQRYILDSIVEIIRQKNPDILLIAGDIYDKSLPSAEAVELFDSFMTKLAVQHTKTGLKTFVISGNHDSPERIGYFNKLIEVSGIYTDGVFDGIAHKNTVECSGEKVNIFSLPFVRPSYVRRAYPDKAAEITDYTTAVKTVFEHSDINPKEINILVAHQFVTGSEVSGSESEIGTLDNVEPYVFEQFSYVALGHIHGSQIIGKNKNIAYSGSPLKYSKSECRNKKCAIFGEISKDGLSLEKIALKPLHDMRIVKGTLRELVENPIKNTYDNSTDDYVFAELTDEMLVTNAFSTLETVYPNIMTLEYVNLASSEFDYESAARLEGKSNVEMFADFYKMQNGKEISSEALKIVEDTFKELGGDENETD